MRQGMRLLPLRLAGLAASGSFYRDWQRQQAPKLEGKCKQSVSVMGINGIDPLFALSTLRKHGLNEPALKHGPLKLLQWRRHLDCFPSFTSAVGRISFLCVREKPFFLALGVRAASASPYIVTLNVDLCLVSPASTTLRSTNCNPS